MATGNRDQSVFGRRVRKESWRGQGSSGKCRGELRAV